MIQLKKKIKDTYTR